MLPIEDAHNMTVFDVYVTSVEVGVAEEEGGVDAVGRLKPFEV
jgi:hypothetical protein